MYGHQLVTHWAGNSYRGPVSAAGARCAGLCVGVVLGRQHARALTPRRHPHRRPQKHFNDVDADMVPVPHFGVCLTVDDFKKLADRLQAAGTKFTLEPKL